MHEDTNSVNMSRIALIPARGGSKRIPRKNIREFCGKPMIAYPIQAARDSGLFDAVIVSTEDDEIATVAERHGASVPFRRPLELADDYVATIPVVQHAIRTLEEQVSRFDYVCVLYATTPMVVAEDLVLGWKTFVESGADFAFTACKFSSPIQRAFKIAGNGRVEMFFPEHYESRSQDLEQAYHDAGQFYWGTKTAFLSETRIFSEKAAPIVLPRFKVQDIDTEEDWIMAEMLSKIANSQAVAI